MERQRMMCLVLTWVQNIRNDGQKMAVGRTTYGECPSGDAGPGRGTKGLQKGGIKRRGLWGEGRRTMILNRVSALYGSLCFPCGHRVPGFSLLPFRNFPELGKTTNLQFPHS